METEQDFARENRPAARLPALALVGRRDLLDTIEEK